jgi:protocatechuate 3,4-dioxygenase beta subunit
MRPNHLHLMIEAAGYHKLITALYPEGDQFLASDAVFGVKKSLIVVSLFTCKRYTEKVVLISNG